jgi:heat-inducible transcriptional repressor
LLNAILDIIMSEDKERVFLSGTTSIFKQPEFDDLERVQILLDTLEHGYRLMQWLEDSARTQKVLVRIGSENSDEDIRDCSVVASSYQLDDESEGTLGIIGPTRMNYARAISAVGFVSDSLSKVLIELRH